MKPKMTPKEAIEQLRWIEVGELHLNFNEKDFEAFDLAVEALKKQIPKKVEKQQWIDTVCKCGRVFSKSHGDGYHSIPYENQTKYCPECGQALDWEEGEADV